MQVLAFSVAAQSLSDATIDKLLNASLGTLGLVVVIVLLVVLGPVLLYLARRDAKRDELATRLLDEVSEERKDNRRLITQQGETLELLKQQTELNVQRNLVQMQQAVETKRQSEELSKQSDNLANIAASNTRMVGLAARMADTVNGFTAVKDRAVEDIKEHASTTAEGITDLMNLAFAEMKAQIAEIRGMVVMLGEKSSADVRAILERIDGLQTATEKLPDTGSLAGKAATGPDADQSSTIKPEGGQSS